jgi:DNA-nicking Smr family endonuclease
MTSGGPADPPARKAFAAALGTALGEDGRRGRAARSLDSNEHAHWVAATRDARPLRQRGPAPHLPRVTPAVADPAGRTAPVPRTADAIDPLDATLDRTWDRKVRTGAILPDLIIDLHGHGREAAHALLCRMLHKAHGRRARIVLVITGKGKTGAEQWPAPADGVLRAALPEWLATPALRPYVAALRPAHPRHGGAGAWYVILRRQAACPMP